MTDPISGVSSTSNFFDTTDKLCTPTDTVCEWANEGRKIVATAGSPPSGANLGIGFNSLLPFDCAGETEPVGGTIVNINPRNYTVPYTVSLTYAKSETGNGPASDFDVCLSKVDGATAWEDPLEECGSTAVAPCIQERKRVSGGNLLVVLYLEPGDPWGGLS